jgi:two-component system chemotaxis response regulator CheY
MFGSDARILIVDDMQAIRELVRSQLFVMGLNNVVQAQDGEEALKLLIGRRKHGSPFELVISDWNMPKMSGLELLRKVRTVPEWVNLPFILLTSETDREQVAEAILSGVSQYIVKPFTAKIFEEKLKGAWLKHNGGKKTV